MRTYFFIPLVMLIAICAVAVFFEYSDAGTPAVYPDADANYADAIVNCGITGKLKSGESYSGFAYCYVRMTVGSDRYIERESASIWAEVYRDGWWPFGKLKVRTSPTVSAITFGNNVDSSYAYARGTLGSVTKRDSDTYSKE